ATAADSTTAGTTAAPTEAVDQSKIPLTNLLPGWPQAKEINEESGIVMDADTGAIMYSLNRSEIRYPASTTKIMTALLAIENCDLNETVTMGADGLVHTTDGSTNAVTVGGEEFTVEQCLYMALLKSANDIAVQLGVHVGGSVSGFADMMNARAAELGCTNTHFVNASGMPDSDHYTTAEDMAKIMCACLKNETFRKVISTKQYTVPPTNKTSTERVYDNHNQLIQPSSEYYYEYAIGGKTGFTKAAWRTLVTAAEKNGRTLVCVVMRGPDKTDFVDTKYLFEYGFNNFETTELNGVKVTLPTGVSTDTVEQTVTELADGSERVDSYYNKLPVGSAVVTAADAAALTESKNTQAEETQNEGQEKENGGHTGVTILLIVLGVLLAAVLIAGIALLRIQRR
ncbi:MAG: D-alanyl-D-alanine carboxypeptidase family protein, partial [Lachnospiraceae bacterium]|nr:D-alanyl-D-alanine carboxypeptidase family protein [Lachnospiraceae bacterium]